MALATNTLKSDLKQLFGANNQDNEEAKQTIEQFCEDFADLLETYVKSGDVKVTINDPLSDLFSGAIPVPQDGGAAINTKYQSNAAADGKSTGKVE